MKKSIARVFIALLLFPLLSFGQPEKNYIESRVLDEKNSEPLAFAGISNLKTKKTALSRDDGSFSIEIQSLSDTLLISYVGYYKKRITALELSQQGKVLLQPKSNLLAGLTVVANDDYLYRLLPSCRDRLSRKIIQAKTYFELETFIDTTKVELVECYYNGHFQDYDVNLLELKDGRLAMGKLKERAFISTETSYALCMLRLFKHNEYLPANPFEFRMKDLKKHYRLSLVSKFMDEQSRPVYVVDFFPKKAGADFFSGRVWINAENKFILKITLQAMQTSRFPLQPIWKTDSIKSADLEITETFTESGGEILFNHLDFKYQISYQDRYSNVYDISGNAYLYAYDFGQTFTLPYFHSVAGSHVDYRKIGAVPYNEFFWNHTDEFQSNGRKYSNELYFNRAGVIHNSNNIRQLNYDPFHRDLFEVEYISWSPERISFVYDINKQPAPDFSRTPAQLYRLKAQLYLDQNLAQDSLHILTSTIFDPFDSYYQLPIDSMTNCFLNLYFDLMEIQRRELEAKLKEVYQPGLIRSIYDARLEEAERISRIFFKEVERGNNMQAMRKWNQYVFEKLQIDNFAVFHVAGK